MTRRLLVGLVLCLTLLAPSTAFGAVTSDPRTVDEMAAALATDPILVSTVLGTGDARGVHDVLTDLAADVDVPVFVVLAAAPADLIGAEDPADQAAALLNGTLGDGLYIVQFTDGRGFVGGFGTARGLDVAPGQAAARRARDVGPTEYNVPSAALEAELLLRSAASPGQEISDSQLRKWIDSPRAFVPTDSYELDDRIAQRWVYTITAALTVLIAGLTLTYVARAAPIRSGWASTGKGSTPDRSRPVVLNPVDDTVLARVHRRYDELPARQLGSSGASSADEALTAADLVATTGDPLDAMGAWVLALQADRELDRIQRSTRGPYRPCVINPEHGEATATVRLSGSSIDAPSCSACSVSQGTFLTASTWRGERRYLDTSSIWARTGFGALVDDLARQVIADRGAGR